MQSGFLSRKKMTLTFGGSSGEGSRASAKLNWRFIVSLAEVPDIVDYSNTALKCAKSLFCSTFETAWPRRSSSTYLRSPHQCCQVAETPIVLWFVHNPSRSQAIDIIARKHKFAIALIPLLIWPPKVAVNIFTRQETRLHLRVCYKGN